MRQVLFRIPVGQDGWPVYGFGMMLFLAFIACIWLATRRAKKVGISAEVIQDLALWIFLGGLIGARITYLLLHEKFEGIWEFLVAMPQIWTGGIIFYGAVWGATLSYFIGWAISFRHRENVTTLRLADVIAPTIAVGLLLGRVGCFLNGCCYGQVACESCPAVHFPMSAPARYDMVAAGYQTAAGFLTEDRVARVREVQPGSPAEASGLKKNDLIIKVNKEEVPEMTEHGEKLPSTAGLGDLLLGNWPRGESKLELTVKRDDKELSLPSFRPVTIGLQPTQLYESISMLLVLVLLLAFDSVKRRDGQVMALMMICYALHRYVNEILRIDQRPVGFESYFSILLGVGGIGMMIWLSFQKQDSTPVAQGKPGVGTLAPAGS
jgi:phosphatidylglycerol---prolipoprotein diacylglyceryl transferase